MSALSIFDSFALSLYFLGNAIQASAFPDVAAPRKITRASTHRAMSAAFPADPITGLLGNLPNDARFKAIDQIRNLLGHRHYAGRRRVRSTGTLQKDGSYTTDFHEETWHIPGATGRNSSLTGSCCSVISTTSPSCCLRLPEPHAPLLNLTSPLRQVGINKSLARKAHCENRRVLAAASGRPAFCRSKAGRVSGGTRDDSYIHPTTDDRETFPAGPDRSPERIGLRAGSASSVVRCCPLTSRL